MLLTISNVIISILSTSIFPFSSKYSSSTEQFTTVPINSPSSNESTVHSSVNGYSSIIGASTKFDFVTCTPDFAILSSLFPDTTPK